MSNSQYSEPAAPAPKDPSTLPRHSPARTDPATITTTTSSTLADSKQPSRKRRNRPPKHIRAATKQAKLDGIEAPSIHTACRHMRQTGRTKNPTSAQRRLRKKAVKAQAQSASSSSQKDADLLVAVAELVERGSARDRSVEEASNGSVEAEVVEAGHGREETHRE